MSRWVPTLGPAPVGGVSVGTGAFIQASGVSEQPLAMWALDSAPASNDTV